MICKSKAALLPLLDGEYTETHVDGENGLARYIGDYSVLVLGGRRKGEPWCVCVRYLHWLLEIHTLRDISAADLAATINDIAARVEQMPASLFPIPHCESFDY